MILRPHIRGPRLALRAARPEDAPYLHALRTDPALSGHLPPTEGGIGALAACLRDGPARERRGESACYVISYGRRDIGTVQLSDLDRRRFTWGGRVLEPHGTPPGAALEVALLIYRLGFGEAFKREAIFDVRRDDADAIAFHDAFGAARAAENAINVYYRLDAVTWRERAPDLWRTVEAEARAVTAA